MDIYTPEQFNRWVECKEAYVLKSYLIKYQSYLHNKNIIIIHDENITFDKSLYKNKIFVICECESIERFEDLKQKGYIHICNSKDDIPIMLLVSG
jgi:hypothetical protein